MATIEQRTASQRITDEVTSWPDVEAGIGRRGGSASRSAAGRSATSTATAAHFFPKQVWASSTTRAEIDYHPIFPGKRGPAARAIENEEDVRDVIALLRLNYDRAVRRRPLPGLTPLAPEPLPFAPSSRSAPSCSSASTATCSSTAPGACGPRRSGGT